MHQACHMVANTVELGSPSLWGCWRDEGDNRLLKACAMHAHKRVWHRRVLSEFRRNFGTAASSGSRKQLRDWRDQGSDDFWHQGMLENRTTDHRSEFRNDQPFLLPCLISVLVLGCWLSTGAKCWVPAAGCWVLVRVSNMDLRVIFSR